MTQIARAGVLGLGTMGSGIAQVCAQAGLEVVALDTDDGRVNTGLDRLKAFLDGGVRRGKTTHEERDAALTRVHGTTDLGELAGVDVVLEAVIEDLTTKQELLTAVAGIVGPHTPLLTNTSALSVTEVAAAVPEPSRVAGLHFFNPVPVMRLVEVIRALQTDDGTAAFAHDLAARLGKTAVEAKDRPGFLVNRLLMPYLNDVLQAYDDGLASARDIDVAIELGLGHRVGPLALLDLIGLDVHQHATRAAYEATSDQRFAPPPLLSRMVVAGWLGRKTGRGLRVGIEEGE